MFGRGGIWMVGDGEDGERGGIGGIMVDEGVNDGFVLFVGCVGDEESFGYVGGWMFRWLGGERF